MLKVMRCSKIASVKVSEITELITQALLNDKKARKAGGRGGFAESMPQERITALKMDETPVETTDVTERANDIVKKTEAPPQTYPELNNRRERVLLFLNKKLLYFLNCTRQGAVTCGASSRRRAGRAGAAEHLGNR